MAVVAYRGGVRKGNGERGAWASRERKRGRRARKEREEENKRRGRAGGTGDVSRLVRVYESNFFFQSKLGPKCFPLSNRSVMFCEIQIYRTNQANAACNKDLQIKKIRNNL